MPQPAYTYTAVITKPPHDADTVFADVDLGFGVWLRGQSYRLAGLNARELAMPGGAEAQAVLAAILRPGTPITLTSVKPDKFAGRWDCVITLDDGTVLNDWLISQQWAAPWTGKGTAPLPPWPREVP